MNLTTIAGGRDFGVLDNIQLQFPSSSAAGAMLCHNITIVGDNIIEEDEAFEVMLVPVRSVDRVEGSGNIVITIISDIDCK